MAQTLEFQQAHLDQVSRSFAFCIRRLPQPLGRWVGLSYLICRILDTIEDTTWPTPEQQAHTFDRFETAINVASACESLKGWEDEFTGITDGERNLLRDAHFIISDMHEIPENIRGPIRDLVLSMSSGMRHFLKQNKKRKRFSTLISRRSESILFLCGGSRR